MSGARQAKATILIIEDEAGRRLFGDKHIVSHRFGFSLATIEREWIAKRHPDYHPHMYYSKALEEGTGLNGIPARALKGYRGHGQPIVFDLDGVERVLRSNRVGA